MTEELCSNRFEALALVYDPGGFPEAERSAPEWPERVASAERLLAREEAVRAEQEAAAAREAEEEAQQEEAARRAWETGERDHAEEQWDEAALELAHGDELDPYRRAFIVRTLASLAHGGTGLGKNRGGRPAEDGWSQWERALLPALLMHYGRTYTEAVSDSAAALNRAERTVERAFRKHRSWADEFWNEALEALTWTALPHPRPGIGLRQHLHDLLQYLELRLGPGPLSPGYRQKPPPSCRR